MTSANPPASMRCLSDLAMGSSLKSSSYVPFLPEGLVGATYCNFFFFSASAAAYLDSRSSFFFFSISSLFALNSSLLFSSSFFFASAAYTLFSSAEDYVLLSDSLLSLRVFTPPCAGSLVVEGLFPFKWVDLCSTDGLFYTPAFGKPLEDILGLVSFEKDVGGTFSYWAKNSSLYWLNFSVALLSMSVSTSARISGVSWSNSVVSYVEAVVVIGDDSILIDFGLFSIYLNNTFWSTLLVILFEYIF